MARIRPIADVYGNVPIRGDLIVAMSRNKILEEARVVGLRDDGAIHVEWTTSTPRSDRVVGYAVLRVPGRFLIVWPHDRRELKRS